MKLLFPGVDAFLEIDVLSYQHPNSTDLTDLNWLSCKVSCQIGSLGIKEILSLEPYDFIELQKSIIAFTEYISNTIEFQTLEDQLRFTIKRGKSTHIIMQGKITTMPPVYGSFSFEFEAESLFFSTIESLKNIILHFPVIT